MAKGIFGNMFDFNHDGELSSTEQALEFMFLEKIADDKQNNNDDENNK